MKRISVVACVIALVGSTLGRAADDRKTIQTPTPPVTQTCTLKVSGMTCASCDVAVRIAAKTLSGVKTVKVDYPKGKAEVTYDPSKTSPQTIADVITELSGFKTEPVQKAAKK
jgi:copper chaperone CopZ